MKWKTENWKLKKNEKMKKMKKVGKK